MNTETLADLKDRYGIGRKAAASDLSPNAQVLAFRMKTAKQRRQERMLSQIELDSQAWSDWQDAYKTMQAEASYLYEKRKPLPGDLARGGALVAQLSDVHFGALIPENERRRGFSLAMASKRLRLYAQQILNYQLATGADELAFDQITILTKRLKLVRAIQTLSGLSFLSNLFSIFASYLEEYQLALNCFGLGVLIFSIAILMFIYEIQLSTRALSKHLEDLKDLT